MVKANNKQGRTTKESKYRKEEKSRSQQNSNTILSLKHLTNKTIQIKHKSQQVKVKMAAHVDRDYGIYHNWKNMTVLQIQQVFRNALQMELKRGSPNWSYQAYIQLYLNDIEQLLPNLEGLITNWQVAKLHDLINEVTACREYTSNKRICDVACDQLIDLLQHVENFNIGWRQQERNEEERIRREEERKEFEERERLRQYYAAKSQDDLKDPGPAYQQNQSQSKQVQSRHSQRSARPRSSRTIQASAYNSSTTASSTSQSPQKVQNRNHTNRSNITKSQHIIHEKHINELYEFKYTPTKSTGIRTYIQFIQQSERTCSVCLQPFAKTRDTWTVLRCGHEVHWHCLDQLIRVELRRVPLCPTCRRPQAYLQAHAAQILAPYMKRVQEKEQKAQEDKEMEEIKKRLLTENVSYDDFDPNYIEQQRAAHQYWNKERENQNVNKEEEKQKGPEANQVQKSGKKGPSKSQKRKARKKKLKEAYMKKKVDNSSPQPRRHSTDYSTTASTNETDDQEDNESDGEQEDQEQKEDPVPEREYEAVTKDDWSQDAQPKDIVIKSSTAPAIDREKFEKYATRQFGIWRHFTLPHKSVHRYRKKVWYIHESQKQVIDPRSVPLEFDNPQNWKYLKRNNKGFRLIHHTVRDIEGTPIRQEHILINIFKYPFNISLNDPPQQWFHRKPFDEIMDMKNQIYTYHGAWRGDIRNAGIYCYHGPRIIQVRRPVPGVDQYGRKLQKVVDLMVIFHPYDTHLAMGSFDINDYDKRGKIRKGDSESRASITIQGIGYGGQKYGAISNPTRRMATCLREIEEIQNRNRIEQRRVLGIRHRNTDPQNWDSTRYNTYYSGAPPPSTISPQPGQVPASNRNPSSTDNNQSNQPQPLQFPIKIVKKDPKEKRLIQDYKGWQKKPQPTSEEEKDEPEEQEQQQDDREDVFRESSTDKTEYRQFGIKEIKPQDIIFGDNTPSTTQSQVSDRQSMEHKEEAENKQEPPKPNQTQPSIVPKPTIHDELQKENMKLQQQLASTMEVIQAMQRNQQLEQEMRRREQEERKKEQRQQAAQFNQLQVQLTIMSAKLTSLHTPTPPLGSAPIMQPVPPYPYPLTQPPMGNTGASPIPPISQPMSQPSSTNVPPYQTHAHQSSTHKLQAPGQRIQRIPSDSSSIPTIPETRITDPRMKPIERIPTDEAQKRIDIIIPKHPKQEIPEQRPSNNNNNNQGQQVRSEEQEEEEKEEELITDKGASPDKEQGTDPSKPN